MAPNEATETLSEIGTRNGVIETSLGELTVVADGTSLIGIFFPGHWHLPPHEFFGTRVEAKEDPLLGETERQLEEYLQGERRNFDLAIDPRGNRFQRSVWDLLKDIPYGETVSYGALAIELGDKSLAQTVGQAVGRNPISIVIPCHRVVGSGGKLTGYAGGLERKQRLLDLEEPAESRAAKLF